MPGYTPRVGWRGGLHPKAAARLARAQADYEAGLGGAFIVTGGAVHSPDNEAVLMREWLVDHGVPAERVVLEPCARHSTTNLRNAGRILLALGHAEALIVTSDAAPPRRVVEQAFYLGYPRLSGFALRCRLELGHEVGDLEWLEPWHIRFRPSSEVFRSSWKERWMGDP